MARATARWGSGVSPDARKRKFASVRPSSLSLGRVRCYQYRTAKGLTMAAPTPEAIETARRTVQQAKARLQALEARAATLNRQDGDTCKTSVGGLRLVATIKQKGQREG